jgi:hypothetical protein
MSEELQDPISQEEAEKLLLEAVDDIAEVQDHYEELNEEEHEMLRDAKSGIAAVYMHLDGEVVYDL